jgi:DNA polymerase
MSSDIVSPGQLRKAVRQKLESLARAGVTHLPVKEIGEAASGALAAQFELDVEPAESTPTQVISGVASAPKISTGARPQNDSLELVASDVAACTLCQELASSRKQTVPGTGNPHPRLMFLGEAPGADEDAQGKPFVGRAGQLLTQMIENGMKLKRADVFIGNVLKCRPPGNRTPLPQEAAHCRCFLGRQIDLLKPEFICCLGAVAAQNLLATDR